jgi:hypothetical protein
MATLTRSRQERDRLTIMVGMKRQELTLAQAADMLGLSYRQSQRVWWCYQGEGDAGLRHRRRGQPTTTGSRDGASLAFI